jgi:hypothetical protein
MKGRSWRATSARGRGRWGVWRKVGGFKAMNGDGIGSAPHLEKEGMRRTFEYTERTKV